MMNAAWILALDYAPVVLALQDAAPATAPAPMRTLNLTSAVLGYALMALLGGCIVGISLLPSKRGHQD